MAINNFIYTYNGKNSINNVSKLSNWGSISANDTYKKVFAAGTTAYNNFARAFTQFSSLKLTTLPNGESTKVKVNAKLNCHDETGAYSTCSLQNDGTKIEIYVTTGTTKTLVKTISNPVVTKNGRNYDFSSDGLSATDWSNSVTINTNDATSISAIVYAKNKIAYPVAQNYNCGSSYQSLTPNSIKTLSMYPSATKNVSLNMCKITLTKVNQNDETQKLAGAKFNLYSDSNGTNVIDTGITNENGVIEFEGLTSGTYYYKEIKAPVGYSLNSTLKPITINISNGECANPTEVVRNTPQTGNLIIKKINEKNENVSGAKIKIYTITANESNSGTISSSETSSDEYTSTDDKNYQVNYLHFDSNGNYNPNGQNDYFITNGSPKQITGLPVGQTYYVYEDSVPENTDYAIKIGNDAVEITEAKDYTVELINNHSRFKISKQSITTKKELPGATLQILDARGIEIYKWESTTVQKEILGLEDGDYTLVETTAPKGYQKAESIKFTSENGKLKGDADNTLVMYDDTEKFNIPDTLSARNIVLILLGMGVIGIGVGLFVYGVKKRNSI